MSTEEQYLEIRFAGDTHPDQIRSADTAEAIRSFEEFVLEELQQNEPDVDVGDVVVGLVGVSPGSTRLRFRSSYMSKALAVYAAAMKKVQQQEYEDLSRGGTEALQGVQKVGRKYNSRVEFRTQDEADREPLAAIDPEEEIGKTSPGTITGSTTIYGTVRRVGGKTPKVWLQLSSDRYVVCGVSQDQAQHLADRLYEIVGVEGEATWDIETEQITEFEIDKVLSYREKDTQSAIASLAEASGEHFEGIEDVESFSQYLRGESELPTE